MIFVNVTKTEWMKRYPELECISRQCDNCGINMETSLPFITNGYAGLEAPQCSCKGNRYTCRSMVTTKQSEYDSWKCIIKY